MSVKWHWELIPFFDRFVGASIFMCDAFVWICDNVLLNNNVRLTLEPEGITRK